MRHFIPTVALTAVALAGCDQAGPAAKPDTAAEAALGDAPDVTPPTPHLRRLTAPQYRNSLADLFGADLVLPSALEPDLRDAGLQSVGAGSVSLSPRGVEQYEDAAFLVAEQVVGDEDARARWVSCTPTAADDADCAGEIVTRLGRSAWRRPLSADEIERLTGIITAIGADSGDFDTGLTYAVAALLQSPNFLYRAELGVDGADGARVLDDFELATRLSYLLWNTTPDEALLVAAEAGELSTPEGLRAQADRLLADERAREGLRTFFTELLQLDLLEEAGKDPTLFVQASPEVAPAARAETLAVLDRIIFDDDSDYRDFLTTRETWLDPRLAAIYGVPAPSLDGFGATTLPDDGRRRGFLGQASFLVLNAHTSSTSATLRGKFVRERLLCQTMPAPPAGVDTSIPEADVSSPTLKERIATHLEVDECAGCHRLMDPIGLGFENFDAIGRWRDSENGARIDPSGDLDGASFATAWGLGDAVSNHPALGPCLSRYLYKYAVGHDVSDGEEAWVDWLGDAFAADDHRVRALVLRVIESPAFRRVGELDG